MGTKKPSPRSRTCGRRRSHQVNFYMDDTEYEKLNTLVARSGLNKQTYLINAALGAKITDAGSLKEIPAISAKLIDLLNQFKGIGINCNQMAKIANTTKQAPAVNELAAMSKEITNTGKEVRDTCLLLKQLTQRLDLRQR